MQDGEIKWVGVGYAAQVLKVSRQRVHQLIQDGTVAAVKQGTRWMVSLRTVLAYGNDRRPSKQRSLEEIWQ